MTGKIKAGLGGGLIFCMALIGNCRAGDAAAWELAGKSFRSNDFEVKMLENGTVEIYSAGQKLASAETDLAYNKTKLINPVFAIDTTNKTIVLTMEAENGEGKCVRSMKAGGKGIELKTVFPFTFLEGVGMRSDGGCAGYDGGWWQSDTGDEGQMVARKTGLPSGEYTLFKIGPCGEGLTEAAVQAQLSFWRKDSAVGFSVANSQKNTIYLYDWGKVDKEGNPRTGHNVWLRARKTGREWQTTLLLNATRRSSKDIQIQQIKSRIQVLPPAVLAERYGYIPSGHPLPVEVALPSSKEMIGNYKVECLIMDEADKVAVKEVKNIVVTETQEGRVKFDLVAPERKALYWLRVNILDKKDGKNYFSREYPFAVTMKLPELKDIPATSPLGGQPLAGGAMPEGRFAGIKWDRFWATETCWNEIEPEKGKFNWEKADQMVDEAVKAGNEILWCLCRTPDWASRLPSDRIFDAIREKYPVDPIALKHNLKGIYYGKRISFYCPPRDIKDWEDFVRAVVRRYKTKVHYWQVWNEPWWERDKRGKPVGGAILELYMEKGLVIGASPWGFGGSIEDYAELVKSVSKIVHEEDPLGKVVVYGNYFPRDSSEKFYATGVGNYIDILSMHYFYDDYTSARNGMPILGWCFCENMKKAILNFTLSSNIICELKETHFKHTGKHVPLWDTEEGRAKCSTYAGRLGARPLTQAECEKRFGDKVLDVPMSMMSEHQNACWEAQSLLFSLGIGMEKVFLHSGHSVSVSGVGGKLPTEKGIVWAAMASVLSTSSKVEYSPMGNNELDAVTITDISGKKTAVVWSHTRERKVHVRIPVGKNKKFKGLDFLGNPVAMKSEKGWLTIDVCEEPLYIHDLDLGGIFTSDRSFLSIKGEKDIEVVEAGKPYAGEITVANPYISGYSIDGVLESSVKPGGKVTIERGVKLAPGEQKTVPFNIMVEGGEGGEEVQVEFVLKDQGAELGRLKKTYSIVRYQKGTPLPKCPRVMKVDCEAGDWEGIAEYKVDTADRVLVGLEMGAYEQAPIRIWKGAEDLSFTVKTCWREEGIYFLVDVKDNETTPGPEPSCQWDCVEFFVDMRDAAGQSKKEKEKGAVQFSVQPSLGDVPQECKIAFAGNDGKYAKALFMGRKTKTGYMVEGRVEPAGIQLKEGMPVGLDVAVDDGKEPNPENVEERKNQMVWMGTADNYKNTSKWGKFYLGQ